MFGAVYEDNLMFSVSMSENVSIQDNFDEYGAERKLVRATFSVRIEAYLIDSLKSYNVENKILHPNFQMKFGKEKVLKKKGRRKIDIEEEIKIEWYQIV